jgi:hypothetical protein
MTREIDPSLKDVVQPAGDDKWTLAVLLSTDLRNSDKELTGAGSFYDWQQLKKLVEKTSNAPVSVVVSLPHVDATATSLADLRQRASAAPAGSNPQTLVDTYLIRNGRLRLLGSHISGGPAPDIEQLLTAARQAAPSQRLALSVQAHGSGLEMGITSDTQSASTADISHAIRRGLGTGRRLDVLSFNSCKMASSDTASHMQDVTRFLVASADAIAASVRHGFNGQSIKAGLSSLLENPDASGRQLAVSLIKAADSGANGRPSRIPEVPGQLRSGSDTLIAIDMERYQKFDGSLQNLARALRPHLQTPQDRVAIAAAVDLTQSFPSHVRPALTSLRDTKQFAQKILDQIKAGKLTDDGSILAAARRIIDAQNEMTERLHVNHHLYREVGGFSTFLPVASAKTREELVRTRFIVQANLVDGPPHQRLFAYKPELLLSAAVAINLTAAGLSPAEQAKLSGLRQAYDRLSESGDQRQYTAARQSMKTAAQQFMKTPLAGKLILELMSSVQDRDGNPQRNEWQSFVEDLVLSGLSKH